MGINPSKDLIQVDPAIRYEPSTQQLVQDCFYCDPTADESTKIISAVPNHDPSFDSQWLMLEVPHKGRWMGVDEKKRGQSGPTSLDDMLTPRGIENSFIEHPHHDQSIITYSPEHLAAVLGFIRDRVSYYESHDPENHYYLVTRDLGTAVGERSPHPHSHLYATAFIPERVEQEIRCAERYFEFRRRCPYCQLIEEELRIHKKGNEAESRLVYDNEHFIVLSPFAPSAPFETWILPKRVEHEDGSIDEHSSIITRDGIHRRFTSLGDDHMKSLATVYSKVARATYEVTGGAPMRMYLRTMPTAAADTTFLQAQKELERRKAGVVSEGPILAQMYYHPHMKIQPKLYEPSGFTFSSGHPVIPIQPERAASLLREEINRVA